MSAQIGRDPAARTLGVAQPELPVEGNIGSFDGATAWINSRPLAPADLRGHVVVVQFWTYTCINWLRTQAYYRAWSQRYREYGLITVGVHTPEFRFEHDLDNVRWAVDARGIDYPVAVDNDYVVWSSFANHYWPALYFVDAQGRIRHHRFGEGDYERSEIVIRQLLSESRAGVLPPGVATIDPLGDEVQADWEDLGSQESYVGYEQADGFESADRDTKGRAVEYAAPSRLKLNHWALSGSWTYGPDSSMLNQPNGRIAYQFHARDVNLVMGAPVKGTTVPFRVYLDGEVAGAAHGNDVDTNGFGTVGRQRMYQLIRQTKPIRPRRFEIEFLDTGAEAFCFTFG